MSRKQALCLFSLVLGVSSMKLNGGTPKPGARPLRRRLPSRAEAMKRPSCRRRLPTETRKSLPAVPTGSSGGLAALSQFMTAAPPLNPWDAVNSLAEDNFAGPIQSNILGKTDPAKSFEWGSRNRDGRKTLKGHVSGRDLQQDW